jgi:pimeloyl-ACP methyl ester carboxylesterase
LPIDETVVGSLRSYVDTRSGIGERFLTPQIGGKRTVGVLTTPTGDRRDAGWVICHSFGMEQVWLQPVEVAVARQLGASGFTTLRFHAQGYGDSEGSTADVRLESHVRDALDAIKVLVAETGVSRVGLIGARFGATVATLAADRSDARSLVLWEPIIDGRRYMRELLRTAALTEVATAARLKLNMRDAGEMFAEAGLIDVQGYPLGRSVFEEVSAFDLLRALVGFGGDSVVMQISQSPKARPELERLVARLNQMGGRSSLEVLMDHEARRFGLQRYYATPDGQRKDDKQEALSEKLVSLTVSWCVDWDGRENLSSEETSDE